MTATSAYLLRPLRSEEQVRAERETRMLTAHRLSDIEQDLMTRDGYAGELEAVATHLRKFHAHEDAYADLANGLDDLISDFRGAAQFKRLERELDDHNDAQGAAEDRAARRVFHSSVL